MKVWIRIPTSFPLLPLSFTLGYIWQGGARLGRDSKLDSSYLGASYGCSSLPPTYIYEEGGA